MKERILLKRISFFLTMYYCLFFFASCEKEGLSVTDKGQESKQSGIEADTTGSATDTTGTKAAEDQPDEMVRYLALGDSYTIGQSVPEQERFPVLLANELSKAGIPIQDPTIIATTGWTTADLARGIENYPGLEDKYDLVSLLIGVNNQYQGKSSEEYKEEFRKLLVQAIDFADGDPEKVFVVSIPDYGFTPFGASRQIEIGKEIDLFNAINKEVSDPLGVKYFDITPISGNGLADPSLVASDGLHPSGKMYRQWVELMFEEVKRMLETDK